MVSGGETGVGALELTDDAETSSAFSGANRRRVRISLRSGKLSSVACCKVIISFRIYCKIEGLLHPSDTQPVHLPNLLFPPHV